MIRSRLLSARSGEPIHRIYTWARVNPQRAWVRLRKQVDGLGECPIRPGLGRFSGGCVCGRGAHAADSRYDGRYTYASRTHAGRAASQADKHSQGCGPPARGVPEVRQPERAHHRPFGIVPDSVLPVRGLSPDFGRSSGLSEPARRRSYERRRVLRFSNGNTTWTSGLYAS